jgi:DNA repair protein RadC
LLAHIISAAKSLFKNQNLKGDFYMIAKFTVKCVREHQYKYKAHAQGPADIYNFLVNVLEMDLEPVESVIAFALDAAGKVIGYNVISRGTLTQAAISPRDVFQFLLTVNAASCVIAHNHPSGNPKPSAPDIKGTKELIAAGEIMGIKIHDHIIVGENNYTSMKEEGII